MLLKPTISWKEFANFQRACCGNLEGVGSPRVDGLIPDSDYEVKKFTKMAKLHPPTLALASVKSGEVRRIVPGGASRCKV